MEPESRAKLFLILVLPLFSIDLILSLMTNEESVARNIVQFNTTKCRNCFASQHNFPVCGSDGRTYQNPGTLNCAFKCNQKLKFASYGPCPEIDPVEDKGLN